MPNAAQIRDGRSHRGSIARAIEKLSGRLGFQLLNVRAGSAVDFDLPRLHGFWNLADQIDLQKAILESRAGDLDVVCEVELPLERATGYTLEKEVTLLFAFAALDSQNVLLCRQADLVRRKTRQSKRDEVSVVPDPFNIVWGESVLVGALCGVHEVKKAVEADA
jgi:hypothetical protein